MSDRPSMPPAWLTHGVATVFTAVGMSSRAAVTGAGNLVEADLRGTASQGVVLVPLYVERLRKGSITTSETAEIVVDAGAIAVLDAHNAFGQLTGDQAMAMALALALAIKKAHAFGVGAVTVTPASYVGGAYRYAQAAVEADCIGVAAGNSRPRVPVPGHTTAVVEESLLAVGAPVVLDMPMPEAALSKIRPTSRERPDNPSTWSTHSSSQPTTDPTVTLAGMLLSGGDHQGHGLALIVDILAGVLSGGSFDTGVNGVYEDAAAPKDWTHFILALDIKSFTDLTEFSRRMHALADRITGVPTAAGTEPLLLPDQSAAEQAEVRAGTGLPIESSVLSALRETAFAVGVSLPDPC
ncbi:Ldh family oxidoreductase [Streptomyces ureilyticus]|uniref:Ldh family oxidoreductase n=1 Tax=Streptomyces ureilyticus TaxID=1775131 RepID=A0ABX0DYV2_9ACTN|nr:Ldh family oxidoreductase [Streptomyces ureilyticus]NGO46395.1 Ldh family oxidoreductase [Streptomyces ureilyticus]